ncbi:protein of unknown function [Desulfuromusa kysingii]|uniref:PatA-like N-terminal domain-containing protein n=1 Tax=Desulfuromusa kysingii TaxID=37625 RepID=A0A1H3WAM0_9BACT|nr:DUF4388 domain-containing protein [Desulfuromusa kysingii]SDZ84163.1 protein of unknown function [Desulfuromusa kysingii]
MAVPNLKIGSGGTIKLPPEIYRPLGEQPLTVISASSAHLLLGRPDAEGPVIISGILEEGAITDLLSYFNMFRKTGILNIQLDGGMKSLYFQQGEIVFATSSFASEDLGEVLFSLGKIEKDALLELRSQVNRHNSLGKLLVERGIVAPKDLWLAARSQVEYIIYTLFSASAGGFYFQSMPIEQEQILRLSMSTQNIIMEGLRRLDEKALFMRKIISLQHYPQETGKEAADLSQAEAKLMNAAQSGQQNAQDLFRQIGLREFDGMRILFGLIERRLVRMEETPTTEIEGVLGQILAAYNSLFKVIFVRVLKVSPQFPQEVAQSLRDLPQPYSFVLRDVELQADGTLDGHRIVENLVGLTEGDKKKLLADSLCEVAFMETMALRRELDVEQARPLIARVQEVTTKIREMIGRSE